MEFSNPTDTKKMKDKLLHLYIYEEIPNNGASNNRI